MNAREKGFTLLEVSIVVTIIALLLGGIVAGRHLVRASEMRAVITEYDVYLKALKEFQDKYLGLPGDIANAETYWGSDSNCVSLVGSVTPHTATCNGDGGGTIGNSTTAGSLTNTQEWFRAWQQLSNAGMIQGKYSGARGWDSTTDAIIGVNIPASKYSGAGWTLFYYLLTAGDNTNLWNDQYGHVLGFGAKATAGATYASILPATEAMEIDKKIDDGKPGRGAIRAWLSDCVEGDTTQDNTAYDLNSDARNCALVFILGM